MPEIIRQLLFDDMWIDYEALPCPRCRSTNVKVTSHPATGGMATCDKCGARSHTEDWNDGVITMDSNGDGTYRYAGELKFDRPETDVIKVIDTPKYPHLHKIHNRDK